MHIIIHKNTNIQYSTRRITLQYIKNTNYLERRAMRVSASERDLGVQVMGSLKPADQVFKAASKANQVLGSLKKVHLF